MKYYMLKGEASDPYYGEISVSNLLFTEDQVKKILGKIPVGKRIYYEDAKGVFIEECFVNRYCNEILGYYFEEMKPYGGKGKCITQKEQECYS